MKEHVRPTREILMSLIDYDPSTGEFTWKKRDEKYFPSKNAAATWNSRRAGQRAGTTTPAGYKSIRLLGRDYKAHQLAWFIHSGKWVDFVDHENRNPSDNRISNLRSATRSQNNKNKGLYSNNKTGAPGISFSKRSNKWRAVVYSDGKQRSVGSFSSLDEAVKARLSAQARFGFHRNHGIDLNREEAR